MQERHQNRMLYFNEQAYTSEKYVLPFVEGMMPFSENTSVLEIGCGEGGNLKPFLDLGCKRVVGVDMSKAKLDNGAEFFKDHKNQNNLTFIHANIYDVENIGQFDFIMMRDVLEHIHHQEKFMLYVKKFMKPHGKFFLGFPPWVNPFGGHQQICKNKFLSKLPFFHILPASIYKFILKLGGESDSSVQALLEIKETGISLHRFEKIVKESGYSISKRVFYFINPNYEVKFKLKTRKLNKIIAKIPFFREFFITTNYYLLSIEK